MNETGNCMEDAEHEFLRVSEYTVWEKDDMLHIKSISDSEASNWSLQVEPERVLYLRRRVPQNERDLIWSSTNGQCYLCKQSIPRLSPWHVEHVIAFSENPKHNDVLGNMLPSCASCNLRKNDRDLSECITTDLTYDLSTASKEVAHLNTAAKQAIIRALSIKHTRQSFQLQSNVTEDVPSDKTHPIYAILNEIEQNVQAESANSISTLPQEADSLYDPIAESRIDRSDLILDDLFLSGEGECISSGAFGEIYAGTLNIVSHQHKLKQRQKVLQQATPNPCDAATIGEAKEDASTTPKKISPTSTSTSTSTSTKAAATASVFMSPTKTVITQFNNSNAANLVDVAIKVPAMNREHVLTSFVQEIKVLTSLQQHPNIVTCYGWFSFDKGTAGDNDTSTPASTSTSTSSVAVPKAPPLFGIVLEYCSHNLSMSNTKRHVNPTRIFTQIASALEHMHASRCIHRDVKPNNILIHKHKDCPWSDAVAKICDFGSAKYTIFGDAQTKHTYNAGTAAFRPPEVKRGVLVPESDVFSLGATMYEISMDNHTLLGDRDLYAAWQELYTKMRTYNYLDRPTMTEVKDCLNSFHTARDFACVSRLVSHKPEALAELTAAKEAKRAARAAAAGGTPSPAAVANAPLTPPRSRQQNQDEVEVFMSSTARCRENPSGTRNMKYHSTPECRHIVKKSAVVDGIYCLPLYEARDEFRHTACKTCKWNTNTLPSVEEVELDLAGLKIVY